MSTHIIEYNGGITRTVESDSVEYSNGFFWFRDKTGKFVHLSKADFVDTIYYKA